MADSSNDKTAMKIVLGAMTIGAPGAHGVRVSNLDEIRAYLDIFRRHGHVEVDTSRMYGMGTSEEYLGKAGWKECGIEMATKLYPTTAYIGVPGVPIFSHTPEDIEKFLNMSLAALQTDCIDMWYLHGPDRTTPYEVTLKAVNDHYKAGKFKRFGISNYMSWEVAEIVGICKANDYVMPSVYQEIYNAIHRKVEPELIPCLRKFGIAFYAFNPLAGGLFTGRYRTIQDGVDAGSRFDTAGHQGQAYRGRYWNETHFAALAMVEVVATRNGLTLAEIALRWMMHHSVLKREYGDAVLFGASNKKHVEQNLIDFEKGPLPEEVVQILDEAWKDVSPVAAKYYH